MGGNDWVCLREGEERWQGASTRGRQLLGLGVRACVRV